MGAGLCDHRSVSETVEIMTTGNPTVTEKRNSDTEETSNSINWWVELRGLALMLLAVMGFHSFVAKPFYIPSESMLPSLMVGDRLIVSKYPYGWSWASVSFHLAPRGDWRIFGSTPEYGDIVIPTHPERDEDYIKRVVALPGDTVAVENGQIILNGTPIAQEVEPAIRLPVDLNAPCEPGTYPGMRVRQPSGEMVCEMPVLRETLPNGASYLVIDHIENHPLDNRPAVTVPEGHVFVMGDNRDHSADSRAPLATVGGGLGGPVALENIGGRAEFLTFSLDGTTNLNPISWFTSLRSGRSWTTLRAPQVDQPAQAAPRIQAAD